jgi:hypothetical protein
MLKIKFGETELSIKYGYEVTAKSGVLKKLIAVDEMSLGEKKDEKEVDMAGALDAIMSLLPELVLAGVQKFHKDEYGYNYLTGEGKEEQLDKIYALLDDYFDTEDADFQELYGDLQKELLDNGFLASMFRAEKAKSKK